MLNVLGEADGDEGAAAAKQLLDKAYTVPGEDGFGLGTFLDTVTLELKTLHTWRLHMRSGAMLGDCRMEQLLVSLANTLLCGLQSQTWHFSQKGLLPSRLRPTPQSKA